MSYFWEKQIDNHPKITILLWSPVGHYESSFGHISVVVTKANQDISYSLGPKGCDVESSKDYIAKQSFRDGYAFKLKLTPEQAQKVALWFSANFLPDGKSDNNHNVCRYELLTHNCVAPIKSALKLAGINRGANERLPISFAYSLWKNGLVDQVLKVSGCVHRTYPFWSAIIYTKQHPWDEKSDLIVINNCVMY